jgi:hypothetical protein
MPKRVGLRNRPARKLRYSSLIHWGITLSGYKDGDVFHRNVDHALF